MSDDTEKQDAPDDLPAVERSPLLQDNPLQKHFDAVDAEINRIQSLTNPLREQRDALQAKLQPIEDEMRKLARQYNHIERSAGLFQLRNQLGALARAMGGRSLGDGSSPAPEAEIGNEPEGETIETVNYGPEDVGELKTDET